MSVNNLFLWLQGVENITSQRAVASRVPVFLDTELVHGSTLEAIEPDLSLDRLPGLLVQNNEAALRSIIHDSAHLTNSLSGAISDSRHVGSRLGFRNLCRGIGFALTVLATTEAAGAGNGTRFAVGVSIPALAGSPRILLTTTPSEVASCGGEALIVLTGVTLRSSMTTSSVVDPTAVDNLVPCVSRGGSQRQSC